MPRKVRVSGPRSQRRRPKFLGSSSRCNLQLDPETKAAPAYVLTARDDARALLDVVLLVLCCASLRAALRELHAVDARAPEQVGRSLTDSLWQSRTNQQCCSSSSQESLLLIFLFSPMPLPGAAGKKNMDPPIGGRGIACTVLERTPSAGAYRHPPPRRGSAAGTAPKCNPLCAGTVE